MSCLNIDNVILMIIDIQEKLIGASFNKELIVKNAEIISKTASILNIPVIITEQYPKGLGGTISDIKNNIKSENAVYFEKVDFNALTDCNLLKALDNYKKKQIILCGIETHICVSQTAEALINKGYDVSVIKDICSSRSEYEHLSGIELMKQNGANIKTTEIVLFELLKSAKHPDFKQVQALIKD